MYRYVTIALYRIYTYRPRPISMPRLIGLVYLPSYTLLSVLEFSYAKATVKLGI